MVSSLALMTSGLVHLHSGNRVSSSVLPTWGIGPIFLCATAGVGQG